MIKLQKMRGFAGLPSIDEVHILREPTKSIHTRKKERVDFSDVSYMVRDDSGNRLSENINYIASGINPHIDVMYSNANFSSGGSKTTTNMGMTVGGGGSNPYKAIKDGAFRPPNMFSQQNTLPLSRMARPDTSVITNPGLNNSVGSQGYNLMQTIDKGPIKNAISVATNTNYIPINSKASYRIEMPQNVFTQYAIKPELIKVLANTNVNTNVDTGDMIDRDLYKNSGDIRDRLNLGDVHGNISIYVYNPTTQNYSEVLGSVKDKLNIAVQSNLHKPIMLNREDGIEIRVKDYTTKVVNTNAGGQALAIILRDTDDINLGRNMPLHAIGSGYTSYTKDNIPSDTTPIMNNNILTSANTNPNIVIGSEDENRLYDYSINLRRQGNYGEFNNSGTNTTNFNRGNDFSNNKKSQSNIINNNLNDRFNYKS